jgi:hypothetical protein
MAGQTADFALRIRISKLLQKTRKTLHATRETLERADCRFAMAVPLVQSLERPRVTKRRR